MRIDWNKTYEPNLVRCSRCRRTVHLNYGRWVDYDGVGETERCGGDYSPWSRRHSVTVDAMLSAMARR